MQTDIIDRLTNILDDCFEIESLEDISVDTELNYLRMDSLTFIKVVILLEKEFKIHFDDNKLNFYNYKTLKDIVSYIEYKLADVIKD